MVCWLLFKDRLAYLIICQLKMGDELTNCTICCSDEWQTGGWVEEQRKHEILRFYLKDCLLQERMPSRVYYLVPMCMRPEEKYCDTKACEAIK